MKILMPLWLVLASAGPAFAQPSVHLWEKVELTFHARNAYPNAYTNVEVWVDLNGPGFDKRCHGFWDGGDVFHVRVLATRPANGPGAAAPIRRTPG